MKVLLFFHGGSKNRGCEAIVRSGVPIIKKYLPTAEISLLSQDFESDRNMPDITNLFDDSRVEIKKYSFEWFVSLVNLKLFSNENYAIRINYQKIFKHIPTHDVFLSIGGDNYCYGEQPWLYEVDRQIKKAGKKLILWGASIGSEDLSPTKITDLKSFDLLLVRESLTFQNLTEKGVQNVKLCADGAFTMEKEELPLPEGWKVGNTLGFNYSPLVWKKNKASKGASIQLIQHIIDTTDMTVALTPHVMIQGNNDNEILEEFYHHFKSTNRVILLPDNLNAIQYKGYIARMRFFIGARTHATIAAYSNNVPTMVLGYSVKSKGIAKDIFGSERLVLGITEIADTQKLIQKFEELQRDEVELRELLSKKIPHIKEMSYKAGEYLAEIV